MDISYSTVASDIKNGEHDREGAAETQAQEKGVPYRGWVRRWPWQCSCRGLRKCSFLHLYAEPPADSFPKDPCSTQPAWVSSIAQPQVASTMLCSPCTTASLPPPHPQDPRA